MAFVREELPAAAPPVLAAAGLPDSVVIMGGGAAGNAAAETLRQEGYAGPITLLSADASPPCDRPNLSKDYLAGSRRSRLDSVATTGILSGAWHRSEAWRACRGDRSGRASGGVGGWQSHFLWLAAARDGAEPIRLDVPGGTLPHVRVLRTLADCDALIARAATAQRCVVVGASFIGLEVAASLRTRGLRGARRRARGTSDGARHGRRHSATWCARSTSRMGSSSISARPWLRSRKVS